MNYFPSEMQLSAAPQIAKYAYSKIDYHKVLKTKLQQLEKAITEKFGKNSFNDEVQHIFVDSAPALERRWAEKAGLGWIGKNKQLIHPESGSYVFIGILMMNAEAKNMICQLKTAAETAENHRLLSHSSAIGRMAGCK